MNCKHCNAEIEQDVSVCPNCGENLEEDIIVPEVSVEMQETIQPVEEKPKKHVWKWVLRIGGAVLALAILASALAFALGIITWKSVVGLFKEEPDDIFVKEAYEVSDTVMEKKADVVIAKIGDNKLTNAQLQVFYKMQVQEFLNYYGSYLTAIGLDYTVALSEQTCYFDETLTWEQYFLDKALKTWQNYQTMVILSEESDFSISKEQQAELDNFADTMQAQAKESGYESAQEMIEDVLGAGCTVEDYEVYVKLIMISNEFYSHEYTRLTPSDADIEAYFDENVETFKEQGITKDGGFVSSVRHILISPEGGTENEETGEVTYSEKELKAAQDKAEALLAKWKEGEATEQSFADLVKDNTDDTGSAETGGLYEDVSPVSSYVEEFRAWAVDPERKEGDTDIVKTQFGYHIMYFVSGEPYWLQEAGTMLLSERTTQMIEEAIEQHPMKVTYKNIVLSSLDLG